MKLSKNYHPDGQYDLKQHIESRIIISDIFDYLPVFAMIDIRKSYIRNDIDKNAKLSYNKFVYIFWDKLKKYCPKEYKRKGKKAKQSSVDDNRSSKGIQEKKFAL